MSTTTTSRENRAATGAASCVLLNYDFEIPMHIRTLADFREWAHSDSFPDFGRIDFLAGRIEVDMSPEDFYTHGTPKYQIGRLIGNWIDERDLGHVVSDRTRISSPQAELSAEPDLVFIAYETLESDRARLIPSATKAPGSYIEVEGAVDLIVEFISNSSVTKDTRRLPAAYFSAGIREYWLIDARGDEFQFQIHHRGKTEFEPVDPDEEGFQLSEVFQHRFRLERLPHPRARWKYVLHEAETLGMS